MSACVCELGVCIELVAWSSRIIGSAQKGHVLQTKPRLSKDPLGSDKGFPAGSSVEIVRIFGIGMSIS